MLETLVCCGADRYFATGTPGSRQFRTSGNTDEDIVRLSLRLMGIRRTTAQTAVSRCKGSVTYAVMTA